MVAMFLKHQPARQPSIDMVNTINENFCSIYNLLNNSMSGELNDS
jgi:hypothetical protein